jgi:hypothetical protein
MLSEIDISQTIVVGCVAVRNVNSVSKKARLEKVEKKERERDLDVTS